MGRVTWEVQEVVGAKSGEGASEFCRLLFNVKILGFSAISASLRGKNAIFPSFYLLSCRF
jgi:hypothetical protein